MSRVPFVDETLARGWATVAKGLVREAAPPRLAGWPASSAALRRAFSRLMKAPISNLDRAALRALLAVERDVVGVRHALTSASRLPHRAEIAGSRLAPLAAGRA